VTLVNLESSSPHSCGVSRDASGVLYCWGNNFTGELGDGTTKVRSRPAPVV